MIDAVLQPGPIPVDQVDQQLVFVFEIPIDGSFRGINFSGEFFEGEIFKAKFIKKCNTLLNNIPPQFRFMGIFQIQIWRQLKC